MPYRYAVTPSPEFLAALQIRPLPMGEVVELRRHGTLRDHRVKKSGTHADRPIVPGGRRTPGAARDGGGWRGGFRKPKNSRIAGGPEWAGRSLFCCGFGAAPGAATVPSGEADATGVSPLACSRPTSRRGPTKSSARPAGGARGSALTSRLPRA